MSKCEHLIDISPYDPLCDHPCRLYGGGVVEAECETCQYRIEDLERENTKLRELLRNALTYIEYEGCGVECPETGHDATLTPCDTCNRYETESCAYVIEQDARELGIEAEE